MYKGDDLIGYNAESFFDDDDLLFSVSRKKHYQHLIETGVVSPTMDLFDAFQSHGLQDRSGQNEMALDIAEAIRDKHHIMLEAGVGIGKSLGYLIPSLLAQPYLHGPIVIATSSIALSEQLLSDVTQASSLISEITHRPCNVLTALAKGANNYVCPQKLFSNLEKRAEQLRRPLKKSLPKFSHGLLTVPQWVWDEAHHCNERSDFSREIPNNLWRFLNGDPCHLKNCSYKSDCAYAKMRMAIGNKGTADVIIINQDMFIISLVAEYNGSSGMINQNRGLIIVDEAHNLESKTRSVLTKKWTKEQMLKVLDQIILLTSNSMFDERYLKYLENSKRNVNTYFALVSDKVLNDIKEEKNNEDSLRFYPPLLETVYTLKWYNHLSRLFDVLSGGGHTRRTKSDDILDQFGDLVSAIYGLAHLNDPDSQNLIWIERSEKNATDFSLCLAPKYIDRKLHRMLFFQEDTPVILTSATLCHPGKNSEDLYQYQTQTTGFVGDTCPPKLSPFPYDKNSLLYIPEDIEAPTEDHPKYLTDIINRIIELCKLTNGRALILFTAKEDLNQVYDSLAAKDLPWEILKQSEGGSQADIKERFIATKGLLLATGLWEGFNIKGADLSSVIITRLPFPVPDPIIDFKQSLVSNRWEVLVPEMITKLRQGAGRLIRSETDTGILSILDSRASQHNGASYAVDIKESLPIKTITNSISEVKDFCLNKLV